MECCKFNWTLNWNESHFNRFSWFDVRFFFSVIVEQMTKITITFCILNTFHSNESRTDVNCCFFFSFNSPIFLRFSILDTKRKQKFGETEEASIFGKQFDYTVCFSDEIKISLILEKRIARLYDWIDCDRLETRRRAFIIFISTLCHH